MKRSELLFSFLLIPVDYLMLVLAGLAVYFIRYNTFLVQLRPPIFEIGLLEYLQIVLIVSLIWLPIFALAGMYSIHRTLRLIEEFNQVILGCSSGLVLIVLVIFFRHELFGSRFLVLAGYLSGIIFVFLGRVIIRSIQRSLFKKHIGVWRVIVFGEDRTAYNLINGLKNDSQSGYFVIRHFRKLDHASLGSLSNIAKNNGADIVILADPNHGRREVSGLYEFCQEHHLDFSYAADILEAKQSNVEITELASIPIVHIKRTPLDGWGRIVKRIMDVILSSFALIMLLPIFVLCAIFIKLDSKGPVFVRLKRLGDAGRKFELYKFRSMVKDAHKMKTQLSIFNERIGGPLFKIKNDPRITRFGRFLRKWSIDELPNFINVVKGDISLVGPRPHEPEEVSKYSGMQKRLLNIKPGVTGLAQICGRSDLSFDEEARLDLFYIENWNFWLDISILLRTPWVVIRGKNAV
ncbi:sugar transferase [Patescibacteria group bacterium]|nr:sugar transferase [Patescibacteria group bacterium]